MKRRQSISYELKKKHVGYLFIALWLFGFVYLSVIPLAKTVIYSLSDATIEAGFIRLEYIGFAHYQEAFLGDARFLPALWDTLSSVLLQTPMIVIFSLIMAILLNQEFRGRAIARAVFFLPVIIAGSIIMEMITSGSTMEMLMSGELNNGGLFQTDLISELLKDSGLGAELINTISTLVNDIFNLTWKSGIQILIFLAALQSVEGTLYEVAKVEGATAWETFWKITFPMIMPMLTLNVLYTMIDNYINFSSKVFQYIGEYSQRLLFDYASALSWVNFIVLFIVIMIFYVVLTKLSNRMTGNE